MRQRIREWIKRVPVVGKPYVQRDELRATLNRLWQEPGHFYSPIPDLAEVRADAGNVFAKDTRDLGAIDLNEGGQVALIQSLRQYHDDQPFPSEKQGGYRYYFENPAFSYFDAIVFYGLLRHLRPRRVIEVGSGYSSCLMLDTNERYFGNAITCTFIEPYAGLLRSLMKAGDSTSNTILETRVQQAPIDSFLELNDGDILFIDSSHISKTNSDVNYLIFKVLPRLKQGVWIHFHDIFYPFEYPAEWIYQGRAWNEAYILKAFLQHNRAYSIECFNSFLELFHRDTLEKVMPKCLQFPKQVSVPTSAQSIWLKKL